MNEIAKIDSSIVELQNSQKLCSMLLQSPHYRKVGQEGIYAIVEMAKSVGVDPLQALNGGMYFVKGKVEMSALMMNTLIRQAGHSITKDKRSDDTVCILHGKRADNGDTWVEQFSIEDAKKAGIYANQWLKYPKDMLFARALSRLARQLFPDVIKGSYVQGEIQDAVLVESAEVVTETASLSSEVVATITKRLGEHPEYQTLVQQYLDKQGITLSDLDIEAADKILARCNALSSAHCVTDEISGNNSE